MLALLVPGVGMGGGAPSDFVPDASVVSGHAFGRRTTNIRPYLSGLLVPALSLWSLGRLAVLSLLLLSGPSAIFGRVMPVGVDAVDATVQRPLTHVGQEIFERRHPSVADLDAAPAVAMVGEGVGVQASRLHGLPRGVGRVERTGSITSAMTDSRTAATGVLPVAQSSARDDALRSAIASASPSGTRADIRRALDDGERPGPLSGHVNEDFLHGHPQNIIASRISGSQRIGR